MSSSVTPDTSPAPGSTSRGTPTSTTSSARAVAPLHDRFDVARARRAPRCASGRRRAARRRDASTSGSSSSETARPPTCVGQLDGARVRCGWPRRSRRRPAPASASADALARRSPAPSTSTRAAVERDQSSARRARPRPTRPTPRGGRSRSRCGPACRPRPPGGTRATSSWPDCALVLGELPRLAHLAEDLALADDHRVEAGGHAEEVRDRAVVVVRVQVVGELVGVDAGRCSARKSRTS